jgi:sec-independent protein translocase protein TatA
MGLSVWHVIVVLLVVLILFGAGKLPQVMGDVAKGIKNFKAGMADNGDSKDAPDSPNVTHQSGVAAPEAANTDARTQDKTASGGKS